VCSVCFCSLLPRLTLLSSFLDILHCLPRAVGVPLESALNLVSPMSPCGAHDTHETRDKRQRDKKIERYRDERRRDKDKETETKRQRDMRRETQRRETQGQRE